MSALANGNFPDLSDHVAQLERAFTALGRAILNMSAAKGHHGIPGELDRTSYFALVLLDENGPMRVSDLAATIGLDVSTISRSLASLTDAALVEKARDSHDGRVQRIAISGDGRQVLTQACAAKRELLELATATWSDRERKSLATHMTRLAESLRDVVAQQTRAAQNTSHAQPGTSQQTRAAQNTSRAQPGTSQQTRAAQNTSHAQPGTSQQTRAAQNTSHAQPGTSQQTRAAQNPPRTPTKEKQKV